VHQQIVEVHSTWWAGDSHARHVRAPITERPKGLDHVALIASGMALHQQGAALGIGNRRYRRWSKFHDCVQSRETKRDAKLGARSSCAGQCAIQTKPALRPPRVLARVSALMAHLMVLSPGPASCCHWPGAVRHATPVGSAPPRIPDRDGFALQIQGARRQAQSS
jgi:hypothetical protein